MLLAFGVPPELQRNKKSFPKKTQNEKILSVIMMKTLPRLKWTHANMSTEKKKGKLIKKILRYLMLKTLPRLKLTGDAKTKKRLVGAAMVQVTHIYACGYIYLFK